MFEIAIDGNSRATLTGRLDASQADRAMESMSALTGDAVVDCAGLDYISSAGLGVIVETYKRLARAQGSLRLVRVTPRVRNVFALANLDRVLTIE